jgi:hypothetical protein
MEFSFVNHTLVTLEFDEIEALEMDGFGPQNVSTISFWRRFIWQPVGS